MLFRVVVIEPQALVEASVVSKIKAKLLRRSSRWTGRTCPLSNL